MYSQLPMYQRQGKTAFKKDLTNSISLANELNNPQFLFKTIHVAGTNGKGSTSHMLASILQEAGYNVGLYTSPHLKDFRERIKINGKLISKEYVVDFISRNKFFFEQNKLSFFEMTVGLSFKYFADEQVDIAVIEVGLGGRLDSTNIIKPELTVITNIGLDHTQFLGYTLKDIAKEKAGIIKPIIPVVIGEKQEEISDVFKLIALRNNSPIYFASENSNETLETDLKGIYQKHNVKTVVQSVRILQSLNFTISDNNLKNGLLNVVKNTGLKGRWQQLQSNPKVICDTAHNKEGLFYVMQQIKLEKYQQLHIVLGVVNDKNLDAILPLFPKTAIYYFCKPNIPRGLDQNELLQKATEFHLKGNSYSSVIKAYLTALSNAEEQDFIYCGGSNFVVAELPI